jgi:hypothetical protein
LIPRITSWVAALPLHTKVLLGLATTVLVVELLFRALAPDSAAYRRWTAAIEKVGMVWTAVILSVVYFTTLAAVGLVMRALGKDPLDRSLRDEPTFWRPHEPNPLGPTAAARHQF